MKRLCRLQQCPRQTPEIRPAPAARWHPQPNPIAGVISRHGAGALERPRPVVYGALVAWRRCSRPRGRLPCPGVQLYGKPGDPARLSAPRESNIPLCHRARQRPADLRKLSVRAETNYVGSHPVMARAASKPLAGHAADIAVRLSVRRPDRLRIEDSAVRTAYRTDHRRSAMREFAGPRSCKRS